MRLSIVTTMYHSAPFLGKLDARACSTAHTITDDYEIVFVNDGSPDDSLGIVLGLYERNEHIRIIDLPEIRASQGHNDWSDPCLRRFGPSPR